MAGTTPLSLVQQFDSTGAPLANGQLTFFVAGTVGTKQNAFQDFGLTVPLANPVTLDATGRVPQHWLADGLIHIQLTDSQGLVYVDTTMQVLGPSTGGGGGGGSVDPTTILATGDLKVKYGVGPLSGFVRANALTIGNATSGATERANGDTQNLFIYLYGVDPNLVVSGGRTGNALTDYNANKTIALPDGRGRALAALDDMGNTPAGRLTATYFGTSAIVLGAAGGNEKSALSSINQVPLFTPSVKIYNLSYSVQGGYYTPGTPVTSSAADGVNNGGANPVPVAGTIVMNDVGSASPSSFAAASPMLLATLYIKL